MVVLDLLIVIVFLSESLDKLVENLDEDDFKILKKRIS